MKNVYILTKEGRQYTDEGKKYLLKIIREQMHEKNDLTFCQGKVYNDPAFLAADLEKHPDAYVAISSERGIDLIYADNIDVLIDNLKAYPNDTSWQTAMAPCDNTTA